MNATQTAAVDIMIRTSMGNAASSFARELNRMENEAKSFAARMKTILGNIGGVGVGGVGGSGSGSGRVADAQARAAQADINRMSKERMKWEADLTKSVQRESAIQARSRNADFKRSMNQIIVDYAATERKLSSPSQSSFFSGSFWGTLGANITSQFIGAIASIPSRVSDILGEATKIAAERQNAMKGLQSIADFKGIDNAATQDAIKNLRLVKAGIVDIGSASTSMKNLLLTNFTLQESVTLLEAFSDSAAFGKQSALSFADAIKGGTEGLKQGIPALLDNMGMTKNLSVIMKELGRSEKDAGLIASDAGARHASFVGILKELESQAGNANKLISTYTGSTASLDMAYQNLYAAGGNLLIQNPQLLESNKILAETIDGYTKGLSDASSESGKFAANSVENYALVRVSAVSELGAIAKTFAQVSLTITAAAYGLISGIMTMVEGVTGGIDYALKGVYNKFIDLNNYIKSTSIGKWLGITGAPEANIENDFANKFTFSNAAAEANRITRADANRLGNEASTMMAEGRANRGRIRGAAASNWTAPEDEFANRNSLPFAAKPGSVPGAPDSGAMPKTKSSKVNLNLKDEMSDALGIAAKYGLIITSGKDGKHTAGSAHYTGGAFDVRSNGVHPGIMAAAMRDFRAAGYGVGDELSRPPGQEAWSGAHVHVGGRKGGVRARGGVADSGEIIARFVSDQSDSLTKAERERIVRSEIATAIKLSIRPEDKTISDYAALLSEDVRAGKNIGMGLGKGIQPSANQVEALFKGFGTVSTSLPDLQPQARKLGAADQRFANYEEQYKTAERLKELDERRKYLAIEINARQADYFIGLQEQLAEETVLQELERKRWMNVEAGLQFQRSVTEQMREASDLERDMAVLRAQNASEQFVSQRRINAGKAEELSLQRQITDTQDSLANFDINAPLRVQAGLLEDILSMRSRELDAVISINRSQLEIAGQTQYSAVQANARVMEFMASQKGVTEAMGDFKIGLLESGYDVIDRGLDKIIPKMGRLGETVKELLSSFIRLALNAGFQRLFGGGAGPSQQGGGGNGAGGAFSPSALINRIIGGQQNAAQGGGGSFLTGGFAGGANPMASGMFGGGGARPSNFGFGNLGGMLGDGGGSSLTPSGLPTTIGSGGRFDLSGLPRNLGQGPAAAGKAAGGGLMSQALQTQLMGAIAGGTIGAGIGSGSRIGSVLGAAGGIIGGTLLTGLVATGSVAGATTGGIFGASAGLFGLSGAATFGIGAAVAGAVLLASYFIGRAARRKKEKAQVTQLSGDAISRIQQLITDVKSMKLSGVEAYNAGVSLRDQFVEQTKSLTTKPGKAQAKQQLGQINSLLATLKAEGDRSDRLRSIAAATDERLVPTFASGGFSGLGYGSRMVRMHSPEVILNSQQIMALGGYRSVANRTGLSGINLSASPERLEQGARRPSIGSGTRSSSDQPIFVIAAFDEDSATKIFDNVSPLGVARKVRVATSGEDDGGLVDSIIRRITQ